MWTPLLPSRDTILATEININKYHILSNWSTINYGWFEHVGLLADSKGQDVPWPRRGLAGLPANTNEEQVSAHLVASPQEQHWAFET